ncbi:hypothetical protein [Corynebacterium occultum]|uniref:hypothetical protein n=1 Tax=Corynebacterium occultum TaxID=2675219 RepID=UPI0012E28687|nr:hypothetical protein [Corynebacterium occultum]
MNARQRARLAVQVDQDKLKRQVDLFTEALTAVDVRDQAEIRLGRALNELRGMGLTRADIAQRTGLAPREVSAAMRAATEAETLEQEGETTTPEDTDLTASATPVEGADDTPESGDTGADQGVGNETELKTPEARSVDPAPAQ